MPAVSGVIEFYSSSGAPTNRRQIAALLPNSGQDYNRIGHFGVGGPGTFVTINTYPDTTYIVNEDGNPSGAFTQSGKLTNLKYVNANSVNPNSSGSVAVSTITERDATLCIRFTEPSGNAVATQNAFLRAVRLNASSGVDNEDAIVSGLNIQMFEVLKDTAWTLVSNTALTNYLPFDNRAGTSIVHEFHAGISVSPLAIGIRRDYAYLFKLEYV